MSDDSKTDDGVIRIADEDGNTKHLSTFNPSPYFDIRMNDQLIYLRWDEPNYECELRVDDNSFVKVSDAAAKSRMSRPDILRALEAGDILIDPFDPENLNTVSYDVTLGEWYWREAQPHHRDALYNPYDEVSVRRSWSLMQAHEKQSMATVVQQSLQGIRDDEKIIFIAPGETILAHTIEFVGSRCNYITSDMHGRSSTARNRIKICSDAGFGDIGFHYRWTMEITNLGKTNTVLVVGRRIAQMSFSRTAPVDELYTSKGKYQPTFGDVELMKANWRPEDMLPKQWLDREAQR